MIVAVWKNFQGAWVVAGAIGFRQYMGYTKRKAISLYKQEARQKERR